MASDPFEFTEVTYEGTGIPNFNDSFMELFQETSSDEEEFEGFKIEDIYFGVTSRVNTVVPSPERQRKVRTILFLIFFTSVW